MNLHLDLFLLHLARRRRQRQRRARQRFGGDAGQATAEYALVMLAAAALAGLLIAWATGTDGINRLMDTVIDRLLAGV